MRNGSRVVSTVYFCVTVLAVAGCEGADSPELPAVAADTAALLTTDTLAWYKEGRPVEFGGRHWRPAGKPVALDTISVHAVGEFEGMLVYAAIEEEAATARYLLFPLTDTLWQALEPADSLED